MAKRDIEGRRGNLAGLQLTPRDRLLLEWAGVSGIATLEQLARGFFPGKRTATAQSRIAKLVEAGLMASRWCHQRGRAELAYCLTVSGCECLPPIVQERMQIGWPHLGVVSQQLTANDVRLGLAEFAERKSAKVVDWRSERELRAEFRREVLLAERGGGSLPRREIADAEAVLELVSGEELKLSIEIDGRYFGKALAAKATALGRTKKVTWWVCRSPRRAVTVASACKRHANIRVYCIGDDAQLNQA